MVSEAILGLKTSLLIFALVLAWKKVIKCPPAVLSPLGMT